MDDFDIVEKKRASTENGKGKSLNFRALYSTNHVIDIDEAKKMAMEATSLFEGDGSLKTAKLRKIEEIRIMEIENEGGTLRSSKVEEFSIPDTLAYLFNFADRTGYVIICADDRIDCPILAFSSEGTLGDETDNPGMAYALEAMENYLVQSILNFEENKDAMLAEADVQLQESLSNLKSTKSGTFKVNLNEKVDPLIYTKWGQRDPYNKYTPMCDEYSHTPAGCVAVATAQVMAYYEYPNSLDGYSFNWSGIKTSPFGRNVSGTHKISIAKLMRSIGDHIGINYTCESSGANTSNAVSWLKTLGYQTTSFDYSWEKVKSYLDSKNPILMRGCNKKTAKKKKFLGITIKKTTTYSEGHAWIVDGYKTTTIKNYSYTRDANTGKQTGKLISTTYSNSFLRMNWGWEGKSDDVYYTAGCFAPENSSYNFQYKQELFVARR